MTSFEVLTPPPDKLTTRFIDTTLQQDSRPFANKVSEVNNHIDAGYDEVTDKDLRTDVVHGGVLLLKQTGLVDKENNVDFDFIAPVPQGAVGWGYNIVRVLKDTKLQVIQTKKIERRKFELTEFGNDQVDFLKTAKRKRGIVLDDVSSDGGTGEAMADYLSAQGLDVQLIMVLLYRGDVKKLKSKYRRAAIMVRHIPYMIDWKERLGSGRLISI